MDLVRTIILALLPLGAYGASEYELMTVRDFVIDGPKLAARQAKVKLIGAYILHGNVGVLYADTQAVIMAKYSNAGTQPSIPLLTDDASHELRAAIVSCDSNPATGQSGCQLEIRGRATICTTTNEYGAEHHAPCLDAEDGGYWSPPPPTREQIRRDKEVQEADSARQAREALTLQQAQYRQCVSKMKFYEGSPVAYLIVSVCGNPP